ncbi:MAG: peroxiredoxin [Bdellovibrionales bacterium]
MAAHTQAPKIGEPVPNFELESTGGRRISLQGLRGKNVVLYFYPKDATPGCTLEGHDFTKLHDQFKELGTEVFGVSRDDIKSHEKFKSAECYSVDLLSDTDSTLCNMFDVIKMKNMYGKQVQGIERSTFVLDPDGRLLKEWRGVKVEGHAQQVLDFLRNQQSV